MNGTVPLWKSLVDILNFNTRLPTIKKFCSQGGAKTFHSVSLLILVRLIPNDQQVFRESADDQANVNRQSQ